MAAVNIDITAVETGTDILTLSSKSVVSGSLSAIETNIDIFNIDISSEVKISLAVSETGSDTVNIFGPGTAEVSLYPERNMYPVIGNPLAYEQLTSMEEATDLTVPQGASRALITVSGKPVRLRVDGVDPTSTVGFPLPPGTMLMLDGNLSKFCFIQTAPGSIVDVLYFK